MRTKTILITFGIHLCILFGIFMIWFASITINLGPTFLSGALAANTESSHNAPSCPLVHGPFRHYVLNALWIFINIFCVTLTLFHLRKMYKDLKKLNDEVVRIDRLIKTLDVTGEHQDATENGERRNGTRPQKTSAIEEYRKMRNYLKRMEREGMQRVKMFLIIVAAYVLFWGPLFFVTLMRHPVIGNRTNYEVTLHIAYVHAFVNPVLFLLLHRELRQGMSDVCFGCCESIARWILGSTATGSNVELPLYEPPMSLPSPPMNLPSPPAPPIAASAASLRNLTDVALLQPPLPRTAKRLQDDSIMILPDPWNLTLKPSTSGLYEEELFRRSSLLLSPPVELNDLQMSPTNSDLPCE